MVKRRIYKMPNGDNQLGDYPNRIDPNGLNLAWIITHSCVMNCPYCVGWKNPKQGPTLIDKLGGVQKTSDALCRLRDNNNKNLYITISGGEPTQVRNLPPLIKKLNKNGIIIELHTNLTTGRFSKFIDYMDPSYTGQIMATYHGWKLDQNPKAKSIYIKNFYKGWNAGHTVVLKTIVLPTEVFSFKEKINKLKKELPSDAPILPWVYIHGKPKSVTNPAKAYPQAYTQQERLELATIMHYRRTEQIMYCVGAGFFKGMQCAAGNAYAYMDIDGNIFPCYARARMKDKFGNIKDQKLVLNSGATQCPLPYCGTPFWGLWYGKNPWDYIPKANKNVAHYCRFMHVKG
jgi:organic radical activating enzyme